MVPQDLDLYVLVCERGVVSPDADGRPIVFEQNIDFHYASYKKVREFQKRLGSKYGETRIAKLCFDYGYVSLLSTRAVLSTIEGEPEYPEPCVELKKIISGAFDASCVDENWVLTIVRKAVKQTKRELLTKVQEMIDDKR